MTIAQTVDLARQRLGETDGVVHQHDREPHVPVGRLGADHLERGRVPRVLDQMQDVRHGRLEDERPPASREEAGELRPIDWHQLEAERVPAAVRPHRAPLDMERLAELLDLIFMADSIVTW